MGRTFTQVIVAIYLQLSEDDRKKHRGYFSWLIEDMSFRAPEVVSGTWNYLCEYLTKNFPEDHYAAQTIREIMADTPKGKEIIEKHKNIANYADENRPYSFTAEKHACDVEAWWQNIEKSM